MLDVIDFVTERGGNPENIRESQRRRFADVEIVDEIIALFDGHRKTQYSATQVNSKINDIQKQIGAKKKAKENADELLKQKAELEREKKALVESAAEKDALLRAKIKTVGNYVHDSVPVSNNEDNNVVERTWAPDGVSLKQRDNILSHHEVLLRLDGYDPDRGVKVVGHRGYFLRQWGVFLNQALINYGLEFLSNRGYTALQTPQFMLKDYMGKTAQLEQFDEELYKVTDGDAKNDKYLIATSEQPISAFHADEWLIPKDLPIKYAGYSTCYRREAGSHGRDAWGIYRVHQFEKVEAIPRPQHYVLMQEKSWDAFNDMIRISEEFYKSLELPYQIVSIVSGALNNAASKKLDLEAWFPFQGEYKELVSCSNCTDYQSRALEIRFGSKMQTDVKKKYVHCLNSTLCATTRTMCCILENYQTEEEYSSVLQPAFSGTARLDSFSFSVVWGAEGSMSMPGWAGIFRGRGRGSEHSRRNNSAKPVALRAPKAVNLEAERLEESRHGGDSKKQSAPTLGTNHLGKFAYEDEMPNWLARKLARDGQVCTDGKKPAGKRRIMATNWDEARELKGVFAGVIPALARLVGKSRSISYAYFCHPCVQHVSKLRREGKRNTFTAS
ncbi:Seryl-tRNA synthetase, class IIa [Metarhizium album ARSEF 1941]|uniref:Serine--tRNA ligase, cytoplasmic n=1 Tax=Metarhizium album (strain ARSEF 1941) TaxID=1081103 RepID=A0A0B2WNB0_METAS|nr:Seryl-tRNA synthetase, class IIa [Metarhizium album ARSEF 1941]KHN95433.1 Seryl-tRNA synthetase, class IIa [Metarhizium album ARSEF 1941]